MTLTLSPPIRLHTAMYTSIERLPYLGATTNTRTSDTTMQIPTQVRKPGAMKKCWYRRMSPPIFCSGALIAMITEPTTQRKHPILPNRVSFSFRKMDESTAHTTTESAPMGVTSTASAKA